MEVLKFCFQFFYDWMQCLIPSRSSKRLKITGTHSVRSFCIHPFSKGTSLHKHFTTPRHLNLTSKRTSTKPKTDCHPVYLNTRAYCSGHAQVRTRIAPSPTGFLHIGGFRTALFNYAFAKKHGGKFIIRIEDTDRARFKEGSTENLIKMLEWGNIIADEGPLSQDQTLGPYIQSERLPLYKEYAEKILQV